MRELPITTRTAQTEDGRRLTLQYIILVEETRSGLENYGIRITGAESGGSTAAPGVTMSVEKIYGLIETLASNTVTPGGLMDVLADSL